MSVYVLVHANAQRPLIVVAELSCEADVTNLVDTTVKKFGQLDILVNNAAIAEFDTIETTSLEQYDRVMSVNVRAAFQLTMLCVPHLIATRGNIVNVSSITGTRSISGIIAYCMSKSAVNEMTACTALELASKGVRVNSVNPGVIDTGIHKRSGMSEEERAKYIEHVKESTHPLGRVGDAEEVAQASLSWLPVPHRSSPVNTFTSTADGMQPCLSDYTFTARRCSVAHWPTF